MSFLNTVRRNIVQGTVWLRELKNQMFPKDRLRNIGSKGTKQSGNYLYEEQLSSLQNLETRCNVFDKMIRAEAVVRLSLQCWKVPVKAAKLDITMPPLGKLFALHGYPALTPDAIEAWKAVSPGAVVRIRGTVKGIAVLQSGTTPLYVVTVYGATVAKD